jgi:hypothetical protein
MQTSPSETEKLFHNLDQLSARLERLEDSQYRLQESHNKAVQTLEFNTQATIQVLEVVNAVKAFKTVGQITRAIGLWIAATGGAFATLYEGYKWLQYH